MSDTQDPNIARTVRLYNALFNEADYEVVAESLADGYLFDGKPQTPEELVAWVKGLREAMPDMALVIEDIFGCGENVAVRWQLTGTIKATKKAYLGSGINMVQIVDDRATSNWQGGPEAPLPSPPRK